MNFEQPNIQTSTMFPFADQIGGYYMQNGCMPLPPVLNGHLLPSVITPLMPYPDVNFQPSINCPRKYVIFDQTCDRRQVMYNPAINPDFVRPVFGFDPPFLHENTDQNNATDEKDYSCSFKEDSDDIDALLSTEYEEQEKCDHYYDDDDVVSTARSSGDYSDSSDSCSNYKPTPSRKKLLCKKKSAGDRRSDKKLRRIREMVKALKGIVPGANHMSPICVLDEAVRYLKSLRVEVKKLGVEKA